MSDKKGLKFQHQKNMSNLFPTKVLFSFVYFLHVVSAKHVGENFDENRRISDVDALLEGLAQEQWEDDERPCLDATLALLTGVRNYTLWATWMWDAMQRPTGVLYGSRYQLGNFDQCVKPPWGATHPQLRSQYCLADIHLTSDTPKKPSGPFDPHGSTEPYINTKSGYGRHFNVITRGMCVPSVCRPHSVAKLVGRMHRDTHLVLPHSRPRITVHSCQLAGEIKEYSPGFYAFWLLIMLLFITMISSTCYVKYATSDSVLVSVARSFCANRNWSTLATANADDLRVLNGIRFLSACIVVCGHYLCYASVLADINSLDLEQDIQTKSGSLLLHADVVVDTFFTMSGLLLMRGLIKYEKSGRSPLKHLGMRYFRLLGPYGIMVFYLASVFTHVGSGPLWPSLTKDEQEDCSNNWWLNLLMVNNYIQRFNMCYVVTWYITCDYQLAIFGTILYYLCRRNRRIGVYIFAAALVIGTLVSGFIVYWNETPALLLYDVEKSRNFKENEVFVSTYIQSHNRTTVYLVGMAMGYILSIYKPADHQKSIPMKWSLLGALASLFAMFEVLALSGMLAHREYNVIEAGLFVALNRTVWALAICCLIGVCEYGTVPIISDFLGLRSMASFGRLSYGVYLVHMALVYRKLYSIRAPLTYNILSMAVDSLGVVVMSCFITVILWHIVEAPLVNLANLFLGATPHEKEIVNGHIQMNGVGKNSARNGVKNETHSTRNGVFESITEAFKNNCFKQKSF